MTIDEVYHWNWTRGEDRYREAFSVEPNNATVIQWYALHLSRRGKHEEARLQIERAAGMEPSRSSSVRIEGSQPIFAATINGAEAGLPADG